MTARFVIRLAPFVLVVLGGCDSGALPVAPSGTLISITASPALIEPFGTSEIQVTALHESGVPVRAGTEFRFTATNGTIDPLATTNTAGIARATFRSDGRGPQAQVTATSGAQGAVSASIDIEDTRLVASFDAVITGRTVTFTDTSTGQQPPIAWQWRFGDGASSSVRDPVHTYASPGSYNVKLTVWNPERSASTTRPIGIVGAEARFSFLVSGLTVTFTDESASSSAIISWDWRFGDGTSSNLQSPVHTYERANTYTVKLTIISAADGSDTHSELVTVTDP